MAGKRNRPSPDQLSDQSHEVLSQRWFAASSASTWVSIPNGTTHGASATAYQLVAVLERMSIGGQHSRAASFFRCLHQRCPPVQPRRRPPTLPCCLPQWMDSSSALPNASPFSMRPTTDAPSANRTAAVDPLSPHPRRPSGPPLLSPPPAHPTRPVADQRAWPSTTYFCGCDL